MGQNGRPWVTVEGPGERDTVYIDGDVALIGRSPESDVRLTDLRVSSTHARIERVGGKWRIEDLGSTNGTKVDGERLPPHEPRDLPDQARIEVGPCVIQVHLLGDIAEETTPVVDREVDLTTTERDVLEKLFLHYDTPGSTPRLASNGEIAAARFVSSDAVKLVLRSLYGKFELFDPEERNREALAARAQEWGVTRRRY
ncbi:MAG: FHA domain-containing protein [Actinomycetes bacterium]